LHNLLKITPSKLDRLGAPGVTSVFALKLNAKTRDARTLGNFRDFDRPSLLPQSLRTAIQRCVLQQNLFLLFSDSFFPDSQDRTKKAVFHNKCFQRVTYLFTVFLQSLLQDPNFRKPISPPFPSEFRVFIYLPNFATSPFFFMNLLPLPPTLRLQKPYGGRRPF